MNQTVETPQETNRSTYAPYASTTFKERRLHARTQCNLLVDVDDYETTSTGKMLNISKGGAFVQIAMEKKPEVGQELIVTIPFHKKENYLIIKARVVWVRGNGMGVSFLTQQKLN